jgi:hypothetical protein
MSNRAQDLPTRVIRMQDNGVVICIRRICSDGWDIVVTSSESRDLVTCSVIRSDRCDMYYYEKRRTREQLRPLNMGPSKFRPRRPSRAKLQPYP